jgi:hypothetical protein
VADTLKEADHPKMADTLKEADHPILSKPVQSISLVHIPRAEETWLQAEGQLDDRSSKPMVRTLLKKYSLTLDVVLKEWGELKVALENEPSALSMDDDDDSLQVVVEQEKIVLQLEECRKLRTLATQLLMSATAFQASLLSLDASSGKSLQEMREKIKVCLERIDEADTERKELKALEGMLKMSSDHLQLLMFHKHGLSSEEKQGIQSKMDEIGRMHAELAERGKQLWCYIHLRQQLKQLDSLIVKEGMQGS